MIRTWRNYSRAVAVVVFLIFSSRILGQTLTSAATKSEVYRNDEFGIVLPVPDGLRLCPTPTSEHDHGPVLIVGNTSEKVCHDPEHSRAIHIFAGYNAADVTKKLHDFLTWECVHIAGTPCRPAPKGLKISGLSSEAARAEYRDGWIDIIVVTQAGKPDPAFDASVPSINYSVRLHTMPDRLEQDLRVFRLVLTAVQLSPAK
jgi:hypothetical protein